MTNRVGTKGQLVIEKDIREQLGIEPGSKAIQRVVDGRLLVTFIPPEHNESLAGILSKYVKKSVADVDWHDAMERAWQEELEEDRRLNDEANAKEQVTN